MAGHELQHSKSQVNRAGKTIRYYLEDREKDARKVREAVSILQAFRAAHAYPLTKAGMGLRSMVRTAGYEPQVSQRLKRLPTILDKLRREPTMSLANMQDIGGCRAVLDSVAAVYAVSRNPTLRRRQTWIKDYIESPAESGYRGVHIIVVYDGRRIEVQLRTPAQHDWAVTVERLGGRLDVDLKSGRGPQEVLILLQLISEAMALEESGQAIPAELEQEITRRRSLAEPFL
jgi:ppGpp synthetase/RelA/SpoT-type nucleotidyltranferase